MKDVGSVLARLTNLKTSISKSEAVPGDSALLDPHADFELEPVLEVVVVVVVVSVSDDYSVSFVDLAPGDGAFPFEDYVPLEAFVPFEDLVPFLLFV
jgi:hypothetical protein